MFIKPGINKATGKPLVVRVPRTHALVPETGMEVPATAFWLRRLRDRDVVKASPPVGAPAPLPSEMHEETPEAA